MGKAQEIADLLLGDEVRKNPNYLSANSHALDHLLLHVAALAEEVSRLEKRVASLEQQEQTNDE